MKLTTSLYYLPNDTSIQGIGIEPDFVIEKKFPPTEQLVWFTKNYGRERALSNYIKVDANVEKGELDDAEKDGKKSDDKEKKKTWAERAQAMLETDNQIRDTISLINLLYTGKSLNQALVNSRAKALEFLKNNFINSEKLTLVEVKV
jgi:hypothetical protein